MFTGLIMSLIRIREPYFKFLITKWYKGLFGVLMDENDVKNSRIYVNDSLATFLTSSLNVELVHVILDSITKYTSGYTDPSLNYLNFTEKKFKEIRPFTIDTIVIKNPDKWKVSKLPEFIEAAHEFGSRHKTTIKRVVKNSMAQITTDGKPLKDIGITDEIKVPLT
jgi:hypothetical protein